MATNEMFLAWLNDAYALEKNIARKLQENLDDLEENPGLNEKMPHLKEKIAEHLQQTNQHAETVQNCITRLGGEVSSLKSGMAQVGGMMQAAGTDFAKDVIVKNSLDEYMMEHTEISSYTSLIAAAEELGEQETARELQAILEQEEDMASWLLGQIPAITQQFLRSQE